MNLCIMASGNLGLLGLKKIRESYQIICVFTDKKSAQIIEYCEEKKTPFFVGNPRHADAEKFIAPFEIDILFSVNYLFIIQEWLIKNAKRFSFNIHGSLLPKYRGRTPHVWAIINNETKTGITVHLIDDGCDTGNIVIQKEIPITPDMTGADVLKRFEELYPLLIAETIFLAINNQIQQASQDHSAATYFGVRNPEDGRIIWQWQKERIKNWVRAQASPYPGAFFFYEGQKVIVNSCRFSDYGFNDEETNGKILLVEEKSITVKVQNGALQLTQLIHSENIIFTQGEIVE